MPICILNSPKASDFLHADSPLIELTNPLEEKNWDESVQRLPGATFFHGAAWARVLSDSYGYDPVYLAIRNSGQLLAMLPLMEVDSWLTGRRGVSLPFTDECSPLSQYGDLLNSLLQAALVYARGNKWKYLEFRGGRSRFQNVVSSTCYLGHRLELSADETTLWSHVESSVRRAVRKAEKSGVTVEFSQELKALTDFYGLLCTTRKRHGVPPQPWTFFANIHRHIIAKGKGKVVLAKHGGIPVAGAVFLHSGKSVIYKYGASDDEYQQLRANNLVMWEAIKQYSLNGYSSLDFGRTSLENQGLRQFKLSWGTSETQIDYMKYDLSCSSFVTAKDDAAGWYTPILRKTPLFLSRAAGRLLYRHIA